METGNEIKKILKAAYPTANFKVKKQSGGLNTSFYIYTDLIIKPSSRFYDLKNKCFSGGVSVEENIEYKELKALYQLNETKERDIKNILNMEKIDRDKQSGEILGGANVFLFISTWEVA